MLITLIVLVLLMVGGIALFRSSDISNAMAGQLAFRRDLKNEGERGLARALALLNTGALKTDAVRQTQVATANYSATMLTSNDQGIPNALMSDALLAAAGLTQADLSDNTVGVTVRTVIDRQCLAEGAASNSNCTRIPMDCSTKAGQTESRMGGQVIQCYGTAYRISVRVDGPRSTQAFYQMVVAR